MSFSQQSFNSAMSEQHPSVPRIHAQLELRLTELGIIFKKLFSVWAFCWGNDPRIPQVTTWSAGSLRSLVLSRTAGGKLRGYCAW